jgi:branched-subunit amino acid aminotransferase/4-amino-4-deoxychorismate lyase
MALIWQEELGQGGASGAQLPGLRGDRTGQAVYDSFLFGDSLPLAWPQHVARRARDAALLGLQAPDPEELVDRLQHWRRREGAGLWRVRVDLVADGSVAGDDAATTTVVRLRGQPWRWQPDPPPLQVVSGARLRNPYAPWAGAKLATVAADLMERGHARASGADDALVLAIDGSFSELVHAALLVGFDDGSWGTPSVASAPVRSTTLEALACRCAIAETKLYASDLGRIQWAVALNAVRGVQPICRLDGQSLGPCPDGLHALVEALVLPR